MQSLVNEDSLKTLRFVLSVIAVGLRSLSVASRRGIGWNETSIEWRHLDQNCIFETPLFGIFCRFHSVLAAADDDFRPVILLNKCDPLVLVFFKLPQEEELIFIDYFFDHGLASLSRSNSTII